MDAGVLSDFVVGHVEAGAEREQPADTAADREFGGGIFSDRDYDACEDWLDGVGREFNLIDHCYFRVEFDEDVFTEGLDGEVCFAH